MRQVYYRMRRVFLLQNATVITKCDDFITKCDVYYKLRQYNISSPPCGRGLLRNFVPLTTTADKGPPYLVKTVKKRGIYLGI